MFHVYGLAGRMAGGSIEQWRRAAPVGAVAAARPVPSPDGGHAAAGAPGHHAREALAAYAGAAAPAGRERLREVAEVMSRPALVIAADASVRSAWRLLVERGIGQAPVVSADGVLVGLAGRAELLPPGLLESALGDAAAWDALLAQPVSTVMWTPVPALTPASELRRAAELLLATGLPGLPVATPEGQVAGFVSRTDLLRAIVADPPLDLWS